MRRVATGLFLALALASGSHHACQAAELTEIEHRLAAVGSREFAVQPGDTALARRAHLERRAAHGPLARETAESALRTARIYDLSGAHALSLEYLREAIEGFVAQVPADTNQWADACIRTAVAYLWIEQPDSIRALLDRGMALSDAASRPDSLTIALAFHTRGVFAQRFLADPVAARQWTERGMAIRGRALGPDHPETRTSGLQLANVNLELGEKSQALQHYTEAANAFRMAGPAWSGTLSAVLGNIAAMQMNDEEYERAIETYREALHARASLAGGTHPNDAYLRLSMARGFFELGLLDSAARATDDAAAIYSEVFGPYHREFARVHNLRAGIARRTGRFDEALAHYAREGDVRDSLYGPGHPSVAQNEYRQALVLADLGNQEGALDRALSADETGTRHARAVLRGLPEREGRAYMQRRPLGLNLALTLADESQGGGLDPAQITRVWNAVLRGRGLALDEQSRRRQVALSLRDSTSGAMWQHYLAGCARLADALVKSRLRGQSRNAAIAAADSSLRQIERSLATQTRTIDEEAQQDQADIGVIGAGLADGSALVTYARYRPIRFGARAVTEFGRPALPERYLAFVRMAGADRPFAVPLDSAAPVDSLVLAWRQEMSKGDAGDRSEARLRVIGADLHRSIWEPIQAALPGCDRIFVVPASSLNLFPLSALPIAGMRYVVDVQSIHLLTSETDLLPLESDPARRGAGARLLAVGDVDYDRASSEIPATLSDRTSSPGPRDLFRGQPAWCLREGSARFQPLPNSGSEVRSIAAIWTRARPAGGDEIALLTGSTATERNLRLAAPGSSVLHLATHGIYMDAACDSASGPTRAASERLDLSALALAGANRRVEADGAEDCILTAEEIGTMDLSGTNWVVLSGCQTGLGLTDPAEGIFGLRRAARIAGARTVIASLWPVEDLAARRWMEVLYEKRFGDGLSTDRSVREASLETLARQRRLRRSTHPATWAAFVAAGDPR